MALVFKFADERGNEFDLHGGATTIRLLLDGMQAFTRENRQMWHVGQDGTSQLLDVMHGDRGASFDVWLGGTRDAAYNRLTLLERWLSQAIEAEFGDGRTWPVYLVVQTESATNETWIRVKYGEVDTSTGLIHPVNHLSSTTVPVYGATVILTLAPGTTSEPVQLQNALVNGALQRWNDDKTAPLGWDEYTSATLTPVADRVLIGERACKVTVTATGRGIQSDLATVPAYHLAVGHMWISLDNGSGTWKLELVSTGGTVVASQTGITYAWAVANAEQTNVDRSGNSWYLVKLEQAIGDITVETSMRLRLSETTNIGTDSVYVNAGLIKTVEAISLPPSPDDVKTTVGAGFDDLTLDTDHTTIATDAVNIFEGESSFNITFDTTAGTSGRYQTVTFDRKQQSQLYTAKTWVRFADDGGDSEIVTFELLDSAENVLDSIAFDKQGGATDLGAVATVAATGADTETWYLLTLSGTNTLAPGVFARFRASNTGTSDVQFYASATYLYRGAGPVFDNAFISDRIVYNRADYDESNQNRFNHVLLYNLPGDRETLIDWELTASPSGTGRLFSMWAYPSQRYAYVTQHKECENASSTAGSRADFRPNTSARWAMNTVDATASGGHTAVFTADTATTLTDYIKAEIAPSDLAAWSSSPRAVWVRGKTSDTTSTVWLSLATNGAQTVQTYDAVTFTTANTYEWVFLGIMNLAYFPAASSLNADVVIRLNATAANTKTVTFDAVSFMPAIDNHHAIIRFPSMSAGEVFAVRGSQRAIIRKQTELLPIGGPPWALAPGNITHYVYFAQASSANAHVLSDNIRIRVNIWPQTANLLGTI